MSGKVRDVYRVDDDRLLIVASDRLSAFDVVLPDPIPGKGTVLTQLSLFWFDLLDGRVASHLITADIERYPEALRPYSKEIAGRSMLVHKAEMVPVECVARGYLAGSGWKEYQRLGTVCGIALPAGLRDGDRLPEPIFTPAGKAQSGHDENISFEQMAAITGEETAARLRDLTLSLYGVASEYALKRGIIVADTKFEFGWIDGTLALCDEALTPDSSRFWPLATWKPGGSQQSYDKQYVRDYLETLNWDKLYPGPPLPRNVIEKTSVKYLEAYHVLTGRVLPGQVLTGHELDIQSSEGR